jgi:hypothetical protein
MWHDNPVIAARLGARLLSSARMRAAKLRSRQARNRSGLKERAGVGPVFRSSVTSVSPDQAFKKQLMKEAERRQTLGTTAASCDAARALLERARLTAFHRGSHPREYLIPKVSFRPGFLGRGLHGRYPPSPVPVQGCTSHPGHNAGRHDAQAAREQAAKPPAGTALAPMTRCASASCPSKERGLGDYPALD